MELQRLIQPPSFCVQLNIGLQLEINFGTATYCHLPQQRSFPNALSISTTTTTTMTSTIGIPIKLLNEAQGHIVTLEITSGQTYRGKLLEGRDHPTSEPRVHC